MTVFSDLSYNPIGPESLSSFGSHNGGEAKKGREQKQTKMNINKTFLRKKGVVSYP